VLLKCNLQLHQKSNVINFIHWY